MRIVYITPFYYPVVGGVEEVARRVAEYMAAKGHEVYVITYDRLRVGGRGSLPREEDVGKVRVIRLRPDFTWNNGTYSTELPSIIRKLKPDVVHVHVWRHPHIFQIAKLRRSLKFCAILHSHAPFHRLSQLGLLIWLYHRVVDLTAARVLRDYDRIIALTPHERDILNRLGADPARIRIIPNGFSYSGPSGSSDRGRIVLYLGRISHSKNPELLLKAMRYVKTEVELVLAGPDECIIHKLIEYAKDKGIKLKYLGPIYGESKAKLYSKAYIFAHPTIYEAYGITLLEAQAHGLPCVITGYGGQIYAAPPGITSLHARPNPKDFAEKIDKLFTDSELYSKLSANAKKWALQHTWDKILPRFDAIYQCGYST